MLLTWDENAWDDYLWWQAHDRKVLKRINTLIKDITVLACCYHYYGSDPRSTLLKRQKQTDEKCSKSQSTKPHLRC